MRVLSGIQPSGSIHVGNYFGAIVNWVAEQHRDAFYVIVDLHALTGTIEPEVLREQTFETTAALLAAGLDPQRCTLFVQSQVAFHSQLSWLLECVVSFGELRRMTQFKEKADQQGSHRVGLLTYPVLMASDILLYDTDQVPVGDDQRQHLELTRVIAERFNSRYGEVFKVPTSMVPTAGARVMDLQEPTRKMSKSVTSPMGTIGIFDEPAEIERKIKRAVTDTDTDVRFDRVNKPGLSNLLDLYSAITGEKPEEIATRYTRYGDLKGDLAAAMIDRLAPINERYRLFVSDRAETMRQLSIGAERASEVASATYDRAADAIGLLR